jgi:hypothetical protein
MAWTWALGVVAVAIAASGSVAHEGKVESSAGAPHVVSAPRLLHSVSADFLEDERGGRVLAALEARLLRQGDRTWLYLSASPVGPRVVSPPGVEGVAGYNRISAREIAALAGRGRISVVARGPRGRTAGTVRLGEVREVLERRLRADGVVEHVAVDLGEPSREVCFEVELDGPGLHEVEVLADGHARVRVRCCNGRDAGRVLAVASLSAHGGDRP